MPTITYEPPCPVSMQGSALIADAPCTPLFIAGTCSTTMVGSCPLLRPKSGSHTGMRFLPALVCCAFASSHRQRLSILSILMTRYTSLRHTAPRSDKQFWGADYSIHCEDECIETYSSLSRGPLASWQSSAVHLWIA